MRVYVGCPAASRCAEGRRRSSASVCVDLLGDVTAAGSDVKATSVAPRTASEVSENLRTAHTTATAADPTDDRMDDAPVQRRLGAKAAGPLELPATWSKNVAEGGAAPPLALLDVADPLAETTTRDSHDVPVDSSSCKIATWLTELKCDPSGLQTAAPQLSPSWAPLEDRSESPAPIPLADAKVHSCHEDCLLQHDTRCSDGRKRRDKEQHHQQKQSHRPTKARPFATLHAAMERIHHLVPASGLDNETRGRTRGKTAEIRAAAATATAPTSVAAAGSAPSPDPLVSTSYGAVTAGSLTSVLDFLAAIPNSSLSLQSCCRFIDVGSGIGQVVLHVQLRFALAKCTGIELVKDRYDAGVQTLAKFQLHRRTRITEEGNYKNLVSDLDPFLDDRLDRVHFENDYIEKRLDLLSDATHVFMFDCCFSEDTHRAILHHLCEGQPRIVVTCVTPSAIQRLWGASSIEMDEVDQRFHQLHQFNLTLAGSQSGRVVYVYQTSPAPPLQPQP